MAKKSVDSAPPPVITDIMKQRRKAKAIAISVAQRDVGAQALLGLIVVLGLVIVLGNGGR